MGLLNDPVHKQPDTPKSIWDRMRPSDKVQLDKAALLFYLARGQNLKLHDALPSALSLGEQFVACRKNFLSALRKEWQISQMFLPNAERSNVSFDLNALGCRLA
ncbi:hypothetical protein [Chitinimonas sp. BJB300]|uniref:hypothetical protein n=1 Tax=Chitinimonas sp. BJB300 TaxID=1559339 RepID=UPI000C111514|nr:hypothetical protein [Chitinimonas sp. BJB300]PHV10481.1 hypothetical protein CSQ89_16010 [Chitinimonas sp. BJB300]TSJ87118.1 hypothetical protein FG002_015190 [Chitinimonas sp. BJB300]